ncbi:MAG: Stp1/IreP family PP2C-type Ser/Thr phosphatase [Elusimicrobiota bacterium]
MISLLSKLDIFGLTHAGLVRANNEDNFGIERDMGLMIVADGMGGHKSGEVASALAVSSIIESGKKHFKDSKLSSGRAAVLEGWIQAANAAIYEKAKASPEDEGMGTTVAAVWAAEGVFAAAHVGDSRIYLYRKKVLSLITRDHSWADEKIRLGFMSADEAVKSGLRNVLTRALGTNRKVKVDVSERLLFPGDVILLATDGLTKMVEDRDIAAILDRAQDCAAAAELLIQAANRAGGGDNVTVVIALVRGG